MRAFKYFALLLFCMLSLSARAIIPDADFERLEKALRLKPPQKEQYDLAVGATKRMLLGTAMTAMEMKERFEAEIAKTSPDFGVIAGLALEIARRNKPLLREASDEWSRLYALLDVDQVAIARRFVEQQLALIAP